MVCKDKRKVWVDVKGHERRVLKCQNKAPPKKRTKAPPNKLKVKLPGIEKRRARPPRQARPIATPPATPPRRHRKIQLSPPRATPPRFSATPPPETRPTPLLRKPHKKHPVENYG